MNGGKLRSVLRFATPLLHNKFRRRIIIYWKSLTKLNGNNNSGCSTVLFVARKNVKINNSGGEETILQTQSARRVQST